MHNTEPPLDPEYKRLAVPPLALILCATTVLITLILCFTFLAVLGKDATQLRSLVNTVLNASSVVLSSGTLLYAGSAHKKASRAVEQTNGGLDQRIRAQVESAIRNIAPLPSEPSTDGK